MLFLQYCNNLFSIVIREMIVSLSSFYGIICKQENLPKKFTCFKNISNYVLIHIEL